MEKPQDTHSTYLLETMFVNMQLTVYLLLCLLPHHEFLLSFFLSVIVIKTKIALDG